MSGIQEKSYVPLDKPMRITEHKWPMGTKPLVTTRTMTYMQEDCIRDCIEGILNQKTTFPVQVLIHDDASTDKTAEIIREYEQKHPGVITAYYQTENSFSKPDKNLRRKAFIDLIDGKYIAICEGDDYWTDPLKLQKQAEFLEAHPDYGIVHAEASIYMVHNSRFKSAKTKKRKNIPSGDVFKDLLKVNHIISLTVMYRSSVLLKAVEIIRGNESLRRFQRDSSYWLVAAKLAKVEHMDEVVGVYRWHKHSVSHVPRESGRVSYKRFMLDYRLAFIDYYCMTELKEEVIHDFLERNMPIVSANRSKFADISECVDSFRTTTLQNQLFRYLYTHKIRESIIQYIFIVYSVLMLNVRRCRDYLLGSRNR